MEEQFIYLLNPFTLFFFSIFFTDQLNFSVISLSRLTLKIFHLLANLSLSFFFFPMLFWMMYMLVTVNKHIMCHTCRELQLQEQFLTNIFFI